MVRKSKLVRKSKMLLEKKSTCQEMADGLSKEVLTASVKQKAQHVLLMPA